MLKFFAILLIITVVFASFFNYFKANVLPVVLVMSEATVKALTVNALNNAASMVIDEAIDYKSMVNIEKDTSGSIILVQANTIKINRITRDLALVAQKNVERIGEQTISVPLGAFTGSVIISGFGPEVKLRLLPMGAVTCDFVSFFEEVGINQTRHCIYVNMNAVVNVILPINSVPVTCTATILMCENIIVGKVPDAYFHNLSPENMIDLIPFS
ncbi:MAG: sporulation protein YunB [Clostridia bacterium]